MSLLENSDISNLEDNGDETYPEWYLPGNTCATDADQVSSDSEEESQGFLDRDNLNDFSVLFDEGKDEIPLAQYIPAFTNDSIPQVAQEKFAAPTKCGPVQIP